MLSRIARRRVISSLQRHEFRKSTAQQRRWLVPAPKVGDGPLMERRADRDLPDVAATTFRWRRTLPLFLGVIFLSGLAIFNYQKASSPVVAGTLYALRTNAKARAYLGDEIYFKHSIPYIRGEMNQLHGRINIFFEVRGTKNTAVMRFASFRPSARGMFETTEWSLETTDGRKIDLLEDEGDPFRGMLGGGPEADVLEDEEMAAGPRGFRQMPK